MYMHMFESLLENESFYMRVSLIYDRKSSNFATSICEYNSQPKFNLTCNVLCTTSVAYNMKM